MNNDLHTRIARGWGNAIGMLFLIAIFALSFGGYIWNIVLIVRTVSEPLTAMFILRCVGVAFAPLGVILGFL